MVIVQTDSELSRTCVIELIDTQVLSVVVCIITCIWMYIVIMGLSLDYQLIV